MHRKIKKIYLIVILILLALSTVVLKYPINKIASNKDSDLNVSTARIKDILTQNVTSRKIILKDNEVFIGGAEKELENGYYDVKMYKENNTFKIHINKLWKEYNDTLYEEKYLDELSYSISHIFEMSNVSGLKENILSGYKEAKKVYTSTEDYKAANLEDNNIKLEGIVKNKELVLLVYKEVDDEK